jgi:hypothetical protein
VLVDDWKRLGSELPADWSSTELKLQTKDRSTADLTARLLGPAQSYRVGADVVHFRVARDGSAPSPDGIQRLLRKLDERRIVATLSLVSAAAASRPVEPAHESLVASWDAELAKLPADWTDLVAELELDSSDYVERASLLCVPMNLRRDGMRSALRFRAASRFGYGASPGMVRRCLERCDAEAIRGRVRAIQVLSDTRPVATQGPVWLQAGKTV